EKKKFERLKDQVTINTAVKEILGGVKIEDVTKTVGTVFKDLPNEKNIHIVVEAPPVQDQLMHDLIKQLDTTHLDHDQSSQEKTKPPERSLLHRAFRKHVHIGNEIRDFNKKEEVIGIITEEGGAPRIKCVKDEKSYSTFNAFFMAHFGERPRQNYRDKIRIVNYISYEELSDLYENSQKEKEQEKK
ncbi:12422_t:CDS:2, partial [Funneliformis geosporum]